MNLWKRKLAAYLHDPPSKCLDIGTHGERSDAAFRQAGFMDTEIGEYLRQADHTAAAADRLPFPRSQTAGLQCSFDGVRNAFLHPLTGSRLPFHAEFRSVEQGFDWEQSIQPTLDPASLADLQEDGRWQARFFAHWRLWPRHAAGIDYRMGFLPADTRIPDHSIWTHMQVVSALDACALDGQLRPAFLKFQLGPVQDFIAAARSVRDLWSGSYLLSWLMAAGLKALSARVGPDAAVFPNLREQPLFDLHWRDDLWTKVNIGSKSVWDSLGWTPRDVLIPNLPNVFLAVVPAAGAIDLAQAVRTAIEEEWTRIAEAVWRACDEDGLTADEGTFTVTQRKERFDAQVKRFLSISWQVTPWPESLEDALKLANGFAEGLPIAKAGQRVEAVVRMAQEQMPADHRDGRYYVGGKNGPKEKLNNIGLGWSVILALNNWQLDAVRQTRAFTAANPGGWQVGTFSNKDALTGREEAVAGGQHWAERAKAARKFWPTLFKRNDWLGAPTLIKRVWHQAYLAAAPWNLQTDSRNLPMPNTRGVAAHEPERDCDGDDTAEDAPPSEKYFAVLAFDGDEIGKWISGEKTPQFSTQLADYTSHEGKLRHGALEYFQRDSDPDGKGRQNERFAGFAEAQRPLSPSYHLQLSEALSNFALYCASPIVEVFDGRLIYAGGDDVVALLPADTALECARALRMAFQGDVAIKEWLRPYATNLRDRHLRALARNPDHPLPPYHQKLAAEGSLLHAEHRGFLQRLDQVDQQQHPIPFLVPGPAADCSVGIAIAHFKAPLQDVVRAAKAAEKRAKRDPESGGLGRKAVGVTLMKRSGEIIEWGAKWDGGLVAYQALSRALQAEQLSAKFPHRFVELLEAYITEGTPLVAQTKAIQAVRDFPMDDIVRREYDHCLSRQRGSRFPKDRDQADELLERLRKALDTYLQALSHADPSQTNPEKRLRALIGLCQTVAFAHRTSAEPENQSEPKGTA